MIYHIYWGTSGNSGLYLDEIYQVLRRAGYNQKVFVSAYFPFDYGEKCFFKKADIAHTSLKGKKRAIVQLFELLITFFKIIISAKKEKPTIVNYSNIGTDYFFIYWFLCIIKRVSGCKLIVTCHDVIPHSGNDLKFRKKIFRKADFLLVHADNSIIELNTLGVNISKLVKHPFPIMDLSKIPGYTPSRFKETDFLFIGHLRKDKGIEFLLDAWPAFHKIHPEASLKVCGKLQPGVVFDKAFLEKCNVDFFLEYISDEDYVKNVSSSKYVILPYIKGTNSGIISTVLSVGSNVITSNIPMFVSNPLLCDSDMYEVGSKYSFLNCLEMKYKLPSNNKIKDLEKYRNSFQEAVKHVYDELNQL